MVTSSVAYLASGFVVLGMAVLAMAVGAVVVIGVSAAARRSRVPEAEAARRTRTVAAAGMLALAVQFAVAAAGVLHRWSPPSPLMLMIAAMAVMTTTLAFSKIGTSMAMALPMGALVLSQSFRLPLELIMNQAASEGVMPIQMSFSGSNFDILTGITAVIVGGLALAGKAPKWLLIGWNALGSALLITIVVIAIRSTPIFQAYGLNRLNVWVADPPFVWLPGILVQAALLGHLLLWRRLFAGR